MLTENIDYFIEIIQFPNASVRIAAVQNANGTFDVYLNSWYADLLKDYESEVCEVLGSITLKGGRKSMASLVNTEVSMLEDWRAKN